MNRVEHLAEGVTLYQGDCLSVLADMPENSVDACVTDPPYELGFMGKSWDASGIAFSPETWAAVMRVLKPGGHLVAFGAPKNYHRLACAIEDAGFEIRDSLMWVFGTGFPKSHNLPGGFGTALKPAYEPIVLARKPLSEGTVAANVLRWGTGALNIDATRIAHNEPIKTMKAQAAGDLVYGQAGRRTETTELKEAGRFPANLCHDGSEEVLGLFPDTGKSGVAVQRNGGGQKIGGDGIYSGSKGLVRQDVGFNDSGSAARFFYSAKASKSDRAGSKHPTVKPVSLMQWLVRMVTPPGGIVLDPFAGSGTTGQACINESRPAILIEREAEYYADIIKRLKLNHFEQTKKQPDLFVEPPKPAKQEALL